jgi:putative ABC transport system ATP-binding protein/lipoprotein-releasing system ATP-binding protein
MGIAVENITKSFGTTRVLKNLSFTIKDGEFLAINGKSGSGKTTLLYILSTLDKPTEGRTLIDSRDPHEMTVEKLHSFRNENLGFIFQFHYLLPELTALENVVLPARKTRRQDEFKKRGLELLEQFDLTGKESRLASELSGGEQQRVAIARALLLKPKYIFADEPTGSLDTANSEKVINSLIEINKDLGTTIVLVTHDPDYAALAKRTLHLIDGEMA